MMKKKIKSIIAKVMTFVMVGGILSSTGITVSAANNNLTLTIDDVTYTQKDAGTISVTEVKSSSLTSDITTVSLPGTIDASSKDSEGLNSSVKVEYTGDALKSVGKRSVVVKDGAKISSVADGATITDITFEEGATVPTLTSLFKNWKELTTVTGIENILTGSTVSLTETFSGCTKLSSITIDGATPTLSFNGTFKGCSALNTINIKNINIDSITNLGDNTLPELALTFDTVEFTNNGVSYLYNAFTDLYGTVTFKDCVRNVVIASGPIHLDRAFKGSNMSGKDITVTTTNTKVVSIAEMFSGAKYNDVNLPIDFGGVTEGASVSLVEAFKGATVNQVTGLKSFGAEHIDLNSVLYNTTFGNTTYAENACKMIKDNSASGVVYGASFALLYKGVTNPDYSGLDVSGTNEFTPILTTQTGFISPDKQPEKYYSTSNLYTKDTESSDNLNGYLMTKLTPSSNYISSNLFKSNTQYVKAAGSLEIHNMTDNTTKAYYVEAGKKLSDYLDSEVSYFTDSTLKTTADMSTVVNDNDTVILYYAETTEEAEITEDVPSGVSCEFSEDVDTINIKIDGDSATKSLTGDFTSATIKVAEKATPGSYNKTAEMSAFNKVKFYDIGVTVNDGTDHAVKEITNGYLNITIPVPAGYTSGDLKVYNYHDGLTSDPTEVQYTKSGSNLIIKTNKYSNYAVMYTEGGATVNPLIKTVKVKFNDTGYENDRPALSKIKYYAVFSDGTTSFGDWSIARDTTKYEFTHDVDLTTVGAGKTLTDFTVEYNQLGSTSGSGATYKYNDNQNWDPATNTLTLTHSSVATADPTTKVTYTLKFVDTGVEDNRPANISLNWVATYDDDSTKTGTTSKTLNNTSTSFSGEFTVPSKNGTANLTSVSISPQAINNYTMAKDDTNKIYTYTYQTGATIGTSYFGVKFTNDSTGASYPNRVTLPVTISYDDGTSYDDTVVITVVNGQGQSSVQYNLLNANGSGFDAVSWDWPELPNFTITSSGKTCTYKYTGTTTAETGNYTLTVNFLNDTESASSRPTSIKVNYTAYYGSMSGTTTTGSVDIPISGASGNTKTVTIPTSNGSANLYYVGWQPTGVTGYNVSMNGTTFTYTKTGSSSSTDGNCEYTINFSDSNNKAGKRPSSLTITLADTSNTSNTVTSTLTISNPTTTTESSYKGKVSIPSGKTYNITKVETLPTGYTASYSGTTATLSYTPETVEKTYKVVWEGDGENGDKTRPSSVTIKLKSGDTEYGIVTVSESTNWSGTTKLDKYVKGVEANYTPVASDVSNYSSSVSGDTVTYKFTGTLTKATQEAVANGTAGTTGDNGANGEKTEELYNFDMFDWIDYANRYPDVKKAYGYNKEKLYAHYIHYGIAEGRIATFTGKYANVNEDILKAYFPEDYKYKVASSASGDPSLNIGNDTVSGNGTSGTSGTQVIQNADGTTTIKQKNDDGTTTETILDADGNPISTRTYKTGDMRLSNVTWIVSIMMLIMIAIAGFAGYDLKKDKKRLNGILSQIDIIKV